MKENGGLILKNPLSFLFSKEETEEHLPNNEIFSYAVGLAGQNISYNFISNRLTYFYENYVVSEKGAHVVGKIMTASTVWDAINDILIGGFIDRRPHKPYQKLRPYLLYLPPIVGVLGAMMFIDIGASDLAKLVYLAACYFIWDVFYSFQDTGLWGLMALSSTNSKERLRVAQWISIGAGAGGTIGGAFPILWDLLKGGGIKDKTVFVMFAFIFALGGEILSIRAHKMRERIDAPPQKNESIFKSVSILKHNPTVLLISLARIMKEFYPRINNTYFFQSEYRNSTSSILKGGTAETVFGMLSGLPSAFSSFFATKIIEKVGSRKKTLIMSQTIVIITRLFAFGAGSITAIKYNTPAGFIIMCVILSFNSVLCGIMDIAQRSLISDSIDEVELKTGVRSEGISFSMQNFTSKMDAGLQTLVKNLVLFHVLGYVSNKRDEKNIFHQSEKFYKAQFPLFMLSPIIGAISYIIIISFVKDDKDHIAWVEQQLKARREALESESVNAEITE